MLNRDLPPPVEQPRPTPPGRGDCPVLVRAHSRDDGRVHIDAHCRARPAA